MLREDKIDRVQTNAVGLLDKQTITLVPVLSVKVVGALNRNALFRALVRKGVLTRDEAVRVLLDEAVSRAIQAEAPHAGETTNDVNRQCAEILKFIAEKL